MSDVRLLPAGGIRPAHTKGSWPASGRSSARVVPLTRTVVLRSVEGVGPSTAAEVPAALCGQHGRLRRLPPTCNMTCCSCLRS